MLNKKNKKSVFVGVKDFPDVQAKKQTFQKKRGLMKFCPCCKKVVPFLSYRPNPTLRK